MPPAARERRDSGGRARRVRRGEGPISGEDGPEADGGDGADVPGDAMAALAERGLRRARRVELAPSSLFRHPHWHEFTNCF